MPGRLVLVESPDVATELCALQDALAAPPPQRPTGGGATAAPPPVLHPFIADFGTWTDATWGWDAQGGAAGSGGGTGACGVAVGGGSVGAMGDSSGVA
eukprot:161440-Chlamydomonas_euryale.AAC.1